VINLQDAVGNAGSRFEEGCGGEIDAGRKTMDEPCGDREVLREGAWMRETGLSILSEAEAGVTFEAPRTAAAVAEPFCDDGVAWLHRVYVCADAFDGARPLMARNHGIAGVFGGTGAVQQLKVGTADASGGDADKDLSGARFWHREFDERCLMGGRNLQGEHCQD
jgi:hypothetical protein